MKLRPVRITYNHAALKRITSPLCSLKAPLPITCGILSVFFILRRRETLEKAAFERALRFRLVRNPFALRTRRITRLGYRTSSGAAGQSRLVILRDVVTFIARQMASK